MRERVLNTWKKLVLGLAVVIVATAGLAVTAQAGGASFESAQPLTISQRQQISFETSGDAHYYYFTTDSQAGWYSINLGKSGGAAKYLYVYATADKSSPVLENWYQSSDGNTSTVISLTPNKKYYVMVEPRWNEIGGTANFMLTKINDDYGNDLSTGKVLSLGSTVAGSIEVDNKGEVDAFRFTTTGNNSYYEMAISCTGNATAYATIYKGPDTSYDYYKVSAGSSNTNSIVERLEKNKTYYVLLNSSWDDPTSYKFVVKEIKDDAGDDFTDATKLTNGKTASKTIQVSTDTDFFKIKTAKKQKNYMLTFKNKSNSSMKVTIYSNNDIASAIGAVNNMSVSSATTKTMWLSLKKNRTYYVKVTGGNNCSYNIQLKDLKSVVKKTAPAKFKATGYSGWWSRYTTITWNHKYENAKYEIYRSTSPNSGFKKIKTVKNTSSYTDSKVKKGTTYYYKMRYVVKENGKVCKAKWTKVKKVRIK